MHDLKMKGGIFLTPKHIFLTSRKKKKKKNSRKHFGNLNGFQKTNEGTKDICKIFIKYLLILLITRAYKFA